MIEEAAEFASSLTSKTAGGGFASLKSAAGQGVEASLKSATAARKKKQAQGLDWSALSFAQ